MGSTREKFNFNHLSYNKNLEETKNIVASFRILNFTNKEIINYATYLKKKYNCKIDNNVFLKFNDYMNIVKKSYDLIDEEFMRQFENFKHL